MKEQLDRIESKLDLLIDLLTEEENEEEQQSKPTLDDEQVNEPKAKESL